MLPLKGTRKVIAARMLESMQTTAQLTLNTAADARALLAYRERLKASPEALGLQKVTINDLILFVTARTLLQFPELNTLFQGDTITRHKSVHLGFAVDTPRGLIVPVIRSAHRLSLRQLAAEARRLSQACLDSTVKPDEISGGTFTVTNLGSLGIESFTPILNPPQVAILGVSAITLRPVEVEGSVTFVKHLGLSLTINHQVVDGAPAARFLQALTGNLTNLDIMLAL
jgi:pyruvate dehydrogenase E2 component (dihydrolipoamide acetyltransferase)